MTRPSRSPQTLVELLGGCAAADPDRPYFTLYGATVTYGQVWRESTRYAAVTLSWTAARSSDSSPASAGATWAGSMGASSGRETREF